MAEQEQSAIPASDTAAAVENPQIDTEKVTLEQLEQLFESGTAELPTVSGEAGEEKPAETAEPKEKAVDKPVEPPAKPVGEVTDEPTGEVVEETRTPEEIAEAQKAARERVESEGGDQAAQEAAAEEAAQPQPKAEVEEPAAKPKKEPDEDDEEIGSRPRLKDPIDRAIAAVYRARKGTANEISWAEAEKLVKGDQTSTAPPPAVDLDKVVTDLEAEVTTIKQQLDDAGANEGVFDKTISKLTQDLAEKTADLKLAKRDLRQQVEDTARADAEARTESAQIRTESRNRALEDYPAAADETTKLGAAVARRIVEMKNPRHKNHSVLYADECPYIIVRDVAEELGIPPVVKKKAAAKPPVTPPATPPATPPKSKMSPAPGSKTSVPATQPQEDAKKQLDRLLKDPTVSLEELDNVFEPGGPARTLAAVTA